MLATINTTLCTRCGLCVDDCIAKVIDPKTMAVGEDCIGCGHCIAICPVGAVSAVADPAGGAALGAGPLGFDPGAAAVSPASFVRLVGMKRSLRRYQDRPIAEQDLAAIVDLARHAPTGTNSQAVAMTVLASPERVQAAAALALRFYRRVAALLVNPLTWPFLWVLAGPTMARKFAGYKRHLAKISPENDLLTHRAPALFVFHAPKKSATPAEDAVIWATVASYHAETLGIGSCFNGFMTRAINLSPRLKRLLGIPRGHRVHTSFTAGYAARSYRRSAPRHAAQATILR